MRWYSAAGLLSLSLCLAATFVSASVAGDTLATLEDGLDCKPGSRFKLDCNRCLCSAAGKALCTFRRCPFQGTHSNPDGEQCVADAVWRQDCNICNCVKGNAVCTKKACPEALPGARLSRGPGAECAEGSVWYKGCNTCRCSNGIGVCTRKVCTPGFSLDPDQPECERDSRWKKDCNWCNCVEGRDVCTRMACPPQHPRPVTVTPEAVCTEGSVWYEDCNRCRCTNGVGSCTRMACRPGFSRDPDQPECEGSSRWKKDCNWCKCVAGKGVCTRKVCQQTSTSPATPQAECTEGSHWRTDCNWCTCKNGVAACTRMACKGHTNAEEPECANGSRWRQECNQCACVGGKSVCTRRACLTTPQLTALPARVVEKINICQLPPIGESKAQCTGFLKKWTYRAEEGKCEAIVYGGCGGTENLFDDQRTCEATCGSGNQREESSVDAECTEGSVWYKDCNTCRCTNGLASCTKRLCKPGSSPNQAQPECEGESRWKEDCNWCTCNNGKAACTLKGCLSDIGGILGRPERCYKAPEAGPCLALMRRFAFVPERNRCEIFFFGGCQGNDNNFETPEECQQTCGGDQPTFAVDSSEAAEDEPAAIAATAGPF